jgi:hypothetical protein
VIITATVRAHSLPVLVGLLNGLALASWTEMQDPETRRQIPELYSGKIRYKGERGEQWQTALETARKGYGDCEDLASYRVAELWASGQDFGARVHVRRVTPSLLHVLVYRTGGFLEDPSAILGMPNAPAVQRI